MSYMKPPQFEHPPVMRCMKPSIALLALASGCTTAMYTGPRLPKEATALITEGRGSVIEVIDGRVVRGGGEGSFTVLPGPHVLRASARGSVVGLFVTTQYHGPPAELCLEAEAGHVYRIAGRISADQWTLDVFDDGQPIGKSRLVCEMGPDQPPLQMGASSSLNEGDEWKPPLPGNGFVLGTGLAVGGDRLAEVRYDNGNTNKISAGSGYVFSLGFNLTPLWISSRFGFGLMGEVAWKFDKAKASNGSASLYSFPVNLGLQSFVAISENWYVRLATGPTRTLGGNISISGSGEDAAGDIHSSTGWNSMLGLYWAESWHLGLGFELRYTALKLRMSGQDLDGSSVGVGMSFHLNP